MLNTLHILQGLAYMPHLLQHQHDAVVVSWRQRQPDIAGCCVHHILTLSSKGLKQKM